MKANNPKPDTSTVHGEELIDFGELISSVPGEGLEQLVRQIGQRMDLSPSWSGRGPDGGRDLFFTESLVGPVSRQKIKWVVSCKDKASSNQSISEADLPSPGVKDKVAQHKADGFLLVTTTTPSSGAKALLDGLDKNSGGEIYTAVWDKSDLNRILLRPENHDLLKQFLPESYRRVKRLTSLEGAILALGDQLPHPVLDEVMRLVRPYSDFGMKGSQIWPYDAPSARGIDIVVKKVVIDNDYLGAVTATTEIEFDAFMRLLSRLYRRYPDECYQYVFALAAHHDDLDLRYNAVQFALDYYSGRIPPEQYFTFANALDGESFEDLFGQMISRFVESTLEDNLYAFGIGDDLDMLSSHTAVHGVRAEPTTISRSPDKIEFQCVLDIYVTLDNEREGGMEDTYPGEVRGVLDRKGFHIESASVDTSSFYR